MKALTIRQPWATLIAIGAKRIETRGWSTSYRGPLAIHAAKGFPRDARNACFDKPIWTALHDHFGDERGGDFSMLPRGAVVATCELVEVLRVGPTGSGWRPPSEPERSFGDYSDGRYAWLLANVRPLDIPFPAKGRLGLWEWTA